jgi:hypothetical protein
MPGLQNHWLEPLTPPFASTQNWITRRRTQMGTSAYSENPGFGVSAVTVSHSKKQPHERMA